MAELSPMMRQYLEIKENNKDSLLFFRVGDFYEMFYDDAVTASRELELVLTGKDCGMKERAPMCGVPYHSCEAYIARLIEKGYRVAICEQTEDPATAKGIVKRDVVRVVTPGTVLEDSMLDEASNNFLAMLYFEGKSFGICFVDASTGALHVTEIKGNDLEQRVIAELARFSPKEIVTVKNVVEKKEISLFLRERLMCCLTIVGDDSFSDGVAEITVCRQFNVSSPLDKGLILGSMALKTVGAALGYLEKTQMSGLERISDVNIYTDSEFMRLDITAMRNLELRETMRGKEKRGSLIWVIDKTETAMGKRLIRRWLEQPLMSVMDIETRLNAVSELCDNTPFLGDIREEMAGIHDIERLMTRIVYGTAGGRELRSLCFALKKLPAIKSTLSNAKSRMLCTAYNDIDTLEDISELIDNAIVEEPPFSVREGGIIKKGYSAELESLRSDMTDGVDIILKIEAQEREKTGIKTLKVRYNRIFGYYIEVTNSFKDMVPDHYIRKQTLTNCERYITDELKKLETRVLGAKEHSTHLEFEIFDGIRKTVAEALPRIQVAADALATVDTLCSFAFVSSENNYCRPTLNTNGSLNIVGGRHPVVELLSSMPFVPNDTVLDNNTNRCAIITGPNMAGKSTYMRQVAIIVLLAQIGCFVPAISAEIPICDAIFTRVGASDDLSTGQSTFMVEMSEVASILKNATARSLLILDEIGRGTSTYDGMAIARSVLEFVSNKKKLGAKTLFATHYHELTALEGQLDGVKNYNIAVKKRGDDITFLRRIVRGGADDSYGVEVAKLSGIPESVILRAKEILKTLESEGVNSSPQIYDDEDQSQLTFELHGAKQLLEELKVLDVNTLTPIECMTLLNDICRKAKEIK
jgi:DNA mismatch repair protein MutS